MNLNDRVTRAAGFHDYLKLMGSRRRIDDNQQGVSGPETLIIKEPLNSNFSSPAIS